MNALVQKLIVDLNGPMFLWFYVLAIGAVVVACYQSVRSVDVTRKRRAPQIPARPDPYEIAYLKGGEKEVHRLVLASLLDRHVLMLAVKRDRDTKDGCKVTVIDRGNKHISSEIWPVEGDVLKWPGFPMPARRVLSPGCLPAVLKERFDEYQKKLAEEKLLAGPEMKQLGRRLWKIGSAIILGLGGIKLLAALVEHQRHIGPLLLLVVIGEIALARVCLYSPRLSHRGKAYLRALRASYGGQRRRIRKHGRRISDKIDHGHPHHHRQPPDPPPYSENLLVAEIFGLVSLAHTPLASARDLWNREEMGVGEEDGR